ncbi:MAG: hypothetical protein WBA76_01900 [Phormidesmis sp.]
MLALIAVLLDASGARLLENKPSASVSSASSGESAETLARDCENTVNENSRLSREQLLRLLTIPERDSKSNVRQILQEPYCQLSTLEVRAGVDAIREAYPLEFDPDTALVILYENDEYAGYSFRY